jgi:hypothetical protein
MGHTGISVEYDRQLVGLDPADERRASWFDGTAWVILEQTDTASADDSQYVHESFTLPPSADNNPDFAIYFNCTAGAALEYCYLDNVVVRAGQ